MQLSVLTAVMVGLKLPRGYSFILQIDRLFLHTRSVIVVRTPLLISRIFGRNQMTIKSMSAALLRTAAIGLHSTTGDWNSEIRVFSSGKFEIAVTIIETRRANDDIVSARRAPKLPTRFAGPLGHWNRTPRAP